MDDDTRAMYFTLILYSGEVKGSEIIAKLSSDQNEHVKKLATIGQIIVGVMKGEKQTAELAQVSKMFDDFPATDYWTGFMETSGQVLLTRVLEMSGHNETKKELTKYALELFAKATSAGFSLNKTTVKLLTMVSDREFMAQATLLVRQSSVLKKPEIGLRASIGRERIAVRESKTRARAG